MKEKDFKQTFKQPACTMPPWYNLIPENNRDVVIRQIRQETIDAYGYSMDECPKRKTCFTTSCMGRPLPWKSETAKPYLELLRKTHNISNYDEQLFLANCDNCALATTCKSPCHQVNDFLNRVNNKEPDIITQETLENHVTYIEVDSKPDIKAFQGYSVPWDCLNDVKCSVVRKYLFEGKDFLRIAKELDLTNQARAKYEFYSALTKLSEFATMRKFIDESGEILTNKQKDLLTKVYKDNLSLTDIAITEGITKQAAQQILTRVIKNHNIKWTIFVKKQNRKTIYNVPGVFK